MALRRGVRRREGGALRVTISSREHAALSSLVPQLRAVASGEAEGELADAVRARLFPIASDDERVQAEFVELVGDQLVEGRMDALDRFSRSLAGGQRTRSGWTADLEPDDAAAWLSVVNDARLLLGAAVGIESEADWEGGPDPEDPASVLLYYLGWLEEELVTALMGSWER